MLTPYLPYPPASGGQIRTLNLLKYLSKTNDIVLLSLYKSEKEKQYASHLEEYCKKIYLCKRAEKPWQAKNILKSLFSFSPFLMVRNYSSEAKKVLEDLLEKENFDVIHAETFYITAHLPKTSIPVLLVEQTIEHQVYQHHINSLPWIIRPILSLEILRLKYWEKYYWKKAKMVSVVNRLDRDVIRQIDPKINPVIIPNGAGDEMMSIKLKKKNLKEASLLYVGNFLWLQTVEAAIVLIRDVFPRLLKTNPHLRFIIAGQSVQEKIDSTQIPNLEIIDIPPKDIDMVKNLYEKATIFVAPLFGPGGTSLKILAAMAAGLPIVSTRITAEKLDLKDGYDILVADTPDEYIQKISLLLSDKKLYERIQKNSYRIVRSKYDWRAIAYKLERVYRKLIKYI